MGWLYKREFYRYIKQLFLFQLIRKTHYQSKTSIPKLLIDLIKGYQYIIIKIGPHGIVQVLWLNLFGFWLDRFSLQGIKKYIKRKPIPHRPVEAPRLGGATPPTVAEG